MTIADDIIQHANSFVERQRKHHRRLQGFMKEIDNSNSAIELVQELAVMMNEISTYTVDCNGCPTTFTFTMYGDDCPQGTYKAFRDLWQNGKRR